MQTTWLEPLPVSPEARRWKLPLLVSPSAPRGGYFLLPDDVAAWMGSAKPPVWAVFNGQVSYRGTLVKYGTPQHMLLLRSELREALGSPPEGSLIDVAVWQDREPRTVSVPPELRDALDRDPRARAAFDRCSLSRQSEWVQKIARAKQAETRDRNLNAVLTELRSL
ncbi:MAG: YdeI/OmpD-associated family protein [Bacteroidota bacterium]